MASLITLGNVEDELHDPKGTFRPGIPSIPEYSLLKDRLQHTETHRRHTKAPCCCRDQMLCPQQLSFSCLQCQSGAHVLELTMDSLQNNIPTHINSVSPQKVQLNELQ